MNSLGLLKQNYSIFILFSQMKFSHNSMPFSSHSPKKLLKPPKELLNNLNTQIQTIQMAIQNYNEAQKNSIQWKKLLSMPGNNYQLKVLTQPKLQNILLQSNFTNSISIFGKNVKQRQITGLPVKINDSKNKSNMQRSSGFNLKRSVSLQKNSYYLDGIGNEQNEGRISSNEVARNQKSQDDKKWAEQNPQIWCNQLRPSFKSFRQERGKFDKPVYIRRNQKQKPPTQCLKSRLTQTSKISSNTTPENSFSQSIMFNQNIFKADEGQIELMRKRNSEKLRKRIEQKTLILEKQWFKTESYKEKFNIVAIKGIDQSKVSRNKTKRSISKLQNIINKVEQRRPSTSYSRQTTTKTFKQIRSPQDSI